MIKFLTKQLLYGRIYLWVKDKLGAILFLFISIVALIWICYFVEYLVRKLSHNNLILFCEKIHKMHTWFL